ncbi:hypothetical protein Daci_1957 [Delftia acidovorans SPH-1]|uniref:Uncharacterized protein n=1 Tax=Delftia acidovorans (strain DSM 14801 / SPH-1) TaxID=398578 RepID=A9BYQ4_DELAS|nr:hypothetical protein [Delftia acidovorans]ABX34597.1 hypothetical protein Daci_1957 [Delftia acidovorans SPH-1]QPS76035.1 hypothetical protein I6G48_05625 [Delftia acidovorans]
MPDSIGKIAGGLVGGLFSDSGGGQSQTQTREPWGPAQQGLKDVLNDATKLRTYYQQNPLNQLQQTSYQNLYGDIDNYRQNMAPSMMALSNRLMNSNYQRAPAGSELGGFLQPERGMGAGTYRTGATPGGSVAGGNGAGGALQGLLGQAGQGYSPLMQSGGLLGGISGAAGSLPGAQGPDSGAGQAMQSGGIRPSPMIPTMMTNPGTAYGQIDFGALNPWTSGAIPEPKAPESNTGNLTDAEIEYLRRQAAQDQFRRDQYGYGDGGA